MTTEMGLYSHCSACGANRLINQSGTASTTTQKSGINRKPKNLPKSCSFIVAPLDAAF